MEETDEWHLEPRSARCFVNRLYSEEEEAWNLSPRAYIEGKKSEFIQAPEPRRKLVIFSSPRNMKKHEENMKKYERIMKIYEENMKSYEENMKDIWRNMKETWSILNTI